MTESTYQSKWSACGAFRLALILSVSATSVALVACGDSGERGAEELAKQQELRAARAQAAQDARQGAKIAELERRLNNAGAGGDDGADGGGSSTGGDGPPTPKGDLTGVWRGDAVIEYDDGRSDPFVQTVRLDSLRLSEVSGYSEARQGSTTCHGPLTYRGEAGGWLRFSAEERNVAECIDYSQVELMADGSGALAYRETTDVSVSTGRLERER